MGLLMGYLLEWRLLDVVNIRILPWETYRLTIKHGDFCWDMNHQSTDNLAAETPSKSFHVTPNSCKKSMANAVYPWEYPTLQCNLWRTYDFENRFNR